MKEDIQKIRLLHGLAKAQFKNTNKFRRAATYPARDDLDSTCFAY